MPIPDYTPKDVKRFWSKVDKSGGEDACWIWEIGCNGQGYGVINLQSRAYAAHRFSYLLAYGRFDESLFVCHHCDTPKCVNPHHLFLGTNSDNVRDRVSKGRNAAPLGEKHPSATLTTAQIAEMRRLYSEGVRNPALRLMFGVTRSYSWRIVNNKCRVNG